MTNNTPAQPNTDNSSNELFAWEPPVLYQESWMNTLKSTHVFEGTSGEPSFTPLMTADGLS